ncbi:nicotinate-nucleotide adenylyltransferase [Alkalispirochaeta americana]|uniref:Probable nicotinate-nucleotide adenylyltransferase n=1 Tax=Alkalispirochaeta americana TaxID=159291 RepID=A0A1N6R0H5_9SPIO|nr:nicotinate (nicotinamide) nucleotide adenylyltransferase [Alkalispirochaeta americana]SIQ22358.1 nicotinate-nucleotide adenylyltransferase [Alkalispirochaeta americana]
MAGVRCYQAFLGGSFDPIHLGHLHALRAVKEARPGDNILLIPARLNPLKERAPHAGDAQRLEMVHRATVDWEWCGVSSVEIDRPGPSYTVDTVEHLLQKGVLAPSPGMIVGDDLLQELPRWHAFPRLLETVVLLVLQRDLQVQAVQRFCDSYPAARVVAIPGDPLRVSSTEIRRGLSERASRDSVAHLLPEAVYEFLCRHDSCY